jgi:hypothetical protein
LRVFAQRRSTAPVRIAARQTTSKLHLTARPPAQFGESLTQRTRQFVDAAADHPPLLRLPTTMMGYPSPDAVSKNKSNSQTGSRYQKQEFQHTRARLRSVVQLTAEFNIVVPFDRQ